MSKFWDSPWIYRIMALILALGIFVYVNEEKIGRSLNGNRNDNPTLLATKKQTVSVPLQLNADTDRYFITGYPEKVKVTLEGSAALVTTVVNTQNFRVVADLRHLGVGEHEVKLTQQGLNKQLTYKILPATVKLNIQDRVNKTLPVQVHYNKDAIAEGYQVGSPQLSAETVQVTGARSEIERIFELTASVTLNRNTKSNVSQNVVVQALDSNGNTVNVVVTPETVHVKLPISLPSKRLDVSLKQTGTPVSGKEYSLKSSVKSVMVYGNTAILKELSSLSVPVDVTGISKDETKEIRLSSLNDKLQDVQPGSLKVDIQVEDKAAERMNRSATVN